jgi:hypothetical protein
VFSVVPATMTVNADAKKKPKKLRNKRNNNLYIL